MSNLSKCQRDILDFLSRTEILASAENVSEELDITVAEAENELTALTELGYVSELGEEDEIKLYRSSGNIPE